jgi:hypothetical protein
MTLRFLRRACRVRRGWAQRSRLRIASHCKVTQSGWTSKTIRGIAFLDASADALAYGIAGMARGAAVNGRSGGHWCAGPCVGLIGKMMGTAALDAPSRHRPGWLAIHIDDAAYNQLRIPNLLIAT